MRTAATTADAPPDRKQAILLAAERLFAERGYHAVSIRGIAQEAGVPLALVGYYYGPKQSLFEAIFEHWGASVQERLARLRDALAEGPEGLLGRIVRAFVEPVLALRSSADGEYYALLVARELMHHGPETDAVLKKLFDPMAHAFIDALQKAYPRATRGEVAWCYQFALGSLLHHLNDRRIERLSRGQAKAGDTTAGPMLLRYIEGGIVAAMTAPSRAARRAGPTTTTTHRRRHAA